MGLEEDIKHILSLKDDWDGEGSLAYTKKTTDKVLKYIPKMKELIWKEKKIRLGTPDISPVKTGDSIDIHWETDKYELLLNVPVVDEPATFYWDRFTYDRFRGELSL